MIMSTAVFSATVWVLASMPSNGNVTYSPPLTDLQSCEFLQKSLGSVSTRTRCIQINMAVTK